MSDAKPKNDLHTPLRLTVFPRSNVLNRFSKSIRVISFEREVVMLGNVVSKDKKVNLLLVNLNPIWISLSVRPNSSERTIEMDLNTKNNNPWCSENAPCRHTNTCPVNEHAEEQQRQLHPPRGLKGHRSGPGGVDRCGPAMESQHGMKGAGSGWYRQVWDDVWAACRCWMLSG